MASSDTTRALLWLVLAAAFFGGVTWWKYDDLVGKKKQPTPKESSFQAIRGEGPNAPRAEVLVLDPAGAPVPGARACLFSSQGTVVADDETGPDGKVVLICTTPAFYAAAAWHPDHEIVVVVSSEGALQIQLKPLQHLSVTLGPDSPSQRRWRETVDGSFQLQVNRSFNPLAGKPDFIRFKMYDHLGLRYKKWPATGVTTKIPRPAPSPSTLVYSAHQRLEDHLDRSGRMSLTPPASRAGKSLSTEPLQVNAEKEVPLQVEPQGEHSLTAHYTRREGETGIFMLHLSGLERTTSAPSYGDTVNIESDYSTFQEADGRMTFQVFNLPATPLFPTLIRYGTDGTRQFIRCNPISVQGATETKLERLQLCRLTLKIEGDPDPKETPRSILLLDDHLEPVVHADTSSEGRTYTWSNLPPLTYHVSGRSDDYALDPRVIELKPGEDLELTLTMKPAGPVTLLAKRDTRPQGLAIKNEQGVEYVIVPGTMVRHCAVKLANEDAIITGLRNELFLPYGTYEITPLDRWYRKGKTVKVTVDGPVNNVRLE